MKLLEKYTGLKDKFHERVWKELSYLNYNDEEIDWSKSCIYSDHFYISLLNKDYDEEIRSINFCYNNVVAKWVRVTTTVERIE